MWHDEERIDGRATKQDPRTILYIFLDFYLFLSSVDNIKNQGQEYINNARNSLRIIEERERAVKEKEANLP